MLHYIIPLPEEAPLTEPLRTVEPGAAPRLALYDATTIHGLPWPETEQARYARRYLLPLIEQGTAPWIRNVETTVLALCVDDVVLPVTVGDRRYGDSYVCSPYNHYVAYAREELRLLHPLLAALFSPLLGALGLGLQLGDFNRVVTVNNWLLSTNLYPALSPAQTAAIGPFLRARFPRHALVFRSLSRRTTPVLTAALEDDGYRLVASRQIYLLDGAAPALQNSKTRWLLKRDHGLLAKHGYTVVEADALGPADVPRLLELYNMLYLDKYSRHNPQWTEAFLETARREGTLRLVALRREGRLDAVLGCFWRDGVMTTPIFGYDTSLPVETGLYRMLSAVLIRLAQAEGYLLHESSGAAQFKRNRGAVAEIEYSAVYDRHLSVHRRLCWALVGGAVNRLGIPLMRRYKV